MTANEYITYVGEHYEEMKNKCKSRLSKRNLIFSEDIFQDTLLKIYDNLEKYKDNKLDISSIESFWWQSFLNNTKRDTKYSCHKKDDSIDVLQYLDNFPNEDIILLQDIKEGLKLLTDIEKNLLLMYYLTDVTYTELEGLTGIKDLRYKIQKIVKKIKTKV